MTATQITRICADHDGRELGRWNPETQTIAALIDTLAAIRAANPDVDIAMADLPTRPVPGNVASYPVWAVDYAGDALTGDTATDVESLADIVEWYAELAAERAAIAKATP